MGGNNKTGVHIEPITDAAAGDACAAGNPLRESPDLHVPLDAQCLAGCLIVLMSQSGK